MGDNSLENVVKLSLIGFISGALSALYFKRKNVIK